VKFMAALPISITRLVAPLTLAAVLAQVNAAESEHMHGPDGLEGWTLPKTLENGNVASTTLTIARHGKVIRRFRGDPFIWRWVFQADGQELVYESGPLHFSMVCVRVDTSSGRELGRVDCFTWPRNPPTAGWPAWVDALERSP
jgi:hypothetical protein